MKNTRRTLLLGGAILAVTCLLILLGAVGNGIQATILRAGTAMMTGHVNVGGFYKITSGQAAPILIKAEQLRKDVEELVPEAEHILDRARGFGKVISDTDSLMAGMTGIDAPQERNLREILTMLDGDFDAMTADAHAILLFEKQAERLGVKVGDEVTLSAPIMKGQNNSLDVRVVGIAKDLGLLSIMSCFATKGTLQALYQLDPDTTGVFFIYLDDPDTADEVEGRLRNGLLEKGYLAMDKQDGAFYRKFNQVQGEDWTGMRLDITTMQSELTNLEWTVKTFDTITTLLIGILLVIIMVGVMNAMWIAVRDRTKEIGTLRAIGMGRFRVLTMFLLEALLLAGGAALLGVTLGIGITAALNAAEIPVSTGFQIFLMSDTLRMVVEPGSVIKALVWIPLLTIIGAYFPARRAAKLKPVTAMYHVG